MNSFDLPANFTDHILGGANQLLPNLPIAIFDLLLGILIIPHRRPHGAPRYALAEVPQGLRGVIPSVLEIILWVFLTITLLRDLHLDGLILFFSGSVAAIGIAMAVGGATVISDIIAGIFLARDADFNVGDEVKAGETPTRGIIESMDARRTRLRSKDGKLHVIPNSVIERKEWVLIAKRSEVTRLVKATTAARKLGAAALDKRTTFVQKRRASRNNAQ